jgi:hypothetical protein
MFWTEFTVDTLILLYVLGLFTLIVICLYALIQSKANKLYTFIIIPLALIMVSMTWQGIKVLQGMPVYGLPEKEVEVMWVNDNKPWIYVILKKDGVPVLYKIDWTEENKKKMKELQKMIGSSMVQGKFKETETNNGESNSYVFTPMMDLGEPEEKRSGDDGVEYTPAQSINASPDRPSLETVVDGEAVISSSVVYSPLIEEQAGP